MKILFIIITLLVSSVSCIPGLHSDKARIEKDKELYIASGDSIINTFVWLDVKPIKLQDNKIYYWYYKDKINSTQGNYYGQPLHGDYTVLDTKSRMMLTKGSFYKGLKTGRWMRWYNNGALKETSDWDNGLLNGNYMLYDKNGNIIVQYQYIEGKIIQRNMDNGNSQKNDQIKQGQNTVTQSDSIKPANHFWKRFFKRDNNSKGDKQVLNQK